MCVGLPFGGASVPTPKLAAQQTSEAVAQVTPGVWQSLASKGGTLGAVARRKLQESTPAPTSQYPQIARP
jgi:hypothetical protein